RSGSPLGVAASTLFVTSLAPPRCSVMTHFTWSRPLFPGLGGPPAAPACPLASDWHLGRCGRPASLADLQLQLRADVANHANHGRVHPLQSRLQRRIRSERLRVPPLPRRPHHGRACQEAGPLAPPPTPAAPTA